MSSGAGTDHLLASSAGRLAVLRNSNVGIETLASSGDAVQLNRSAVLMQISRADRRFG